MAILANIRNTLESNAEDLRTKRGFLGDAGYAINKTLADLTPDTTYGSSADHLRMAATSLGETLQAAGGALKYSLWDKKEEFVNRAVEKSGVKKNNPIGQASLATFYTTLYYAGAFTVGAAIEIGKGAFRSGEAIANAETTEEAFSGVGGIYGVAGSLAGMGLGVAGVSSKLASGAVLGFTAAGGEAALALSTAGAGKAAAVGVIAAGATGQVLMSAARGTGGVLNETAAIKKLRGIISEVDEKVVEHMRQLRQILAEQRDLGARVDAMRTQIIANVDEVYFSGGKKDIYNILTSREGFLTRERYTNPIVEVISRRMTTLEECARAIKEKFNRGLTREDVLAYERALGKVTKAQLRRDPMLRFWREEQGIGGSQLRGRGLPGNVGGDSMP